MWTYTVLSHVHLFHVEHPYQLPWTFTPGKHMKLSQLILKTTSTSSKYCQVKHVLLTGFLLEDIVKSNKDFYLFVWCSVNQSLVFILEKSSIKWNRVYTVKTSFLRSGFPSSTYRELFLLHLTVCFLRMWWKIKDNMSCE